MKRLKLFRNAYLMHHGGYVEFDKETDRKLYYYVEDINSGKEHQVTIEFDEKHKVLGARCECTNVSIKAKYLPVCSHTMAVMSRVMFDYGRPKRLK